jgi:putative thiamine transport system ATP-binding protein
MNASSPIKDHTLRFVSVSVSLDGLPLVELDESIAGGEILTVMGSSGSGKSSLLAYAAGFLDPAFYAAGQVLLDGEDVTQLPANLRHVGLLFQDPLLFPHMSVGQNLAFALPRITGQSKAARRQLVDRALQDAGLHGLYDRDPATLSGGQRSRVALMRVLMAEPRALLLDEPFSKLDTQLRNQIRQFVFTEAGKRNLPVLLVTHDREDAEAAGGRTLVVGAS